MGLPGLNISQTAGPFSGLKAIWQSRSSGPVAGGFCVEVDEHPGLYGLSMVICRSHGQSLGLVHSYPSCHPEAYRKPLQTHYIHDG